jgi:hypothetical protein
MPEMENLNQTRVFIQPVVNANRGMQQLSDVETFRNVCSDPWEVFQNFNMVQQCGAKRFRSRLVVNTDMFEDVFEVG